MTELATFGGQRESRTLLRALTKSALPRVTPLPFATLGLGRYRILLVGPSHVGKSTLIAFALVPGLLPDAARPLLIDDNETWFDPFGRAFSLRRSLMLRRHSQDLLAGRLPDLEGFRRYPHEEGALIGAPRARAPMLSRHRIDALVLLNRGQGAPTLIEVRRDTAQQEIATVLKERLSHVPSPRQVRLLHRMIDRSPGGVLRVTYPRAEDGVTLLAQLHERLARA